MNNNKEMTQEVIEESIREIYTKTLNESILKLQVIEAGMEKELNELKNNLAISSQKMIQNLDYHFDRVNDLQDAIEIVLVKCEEIAGRNEP